MEVSWVGLTLKEQLIWMDGTIHSAVFTRKRGRRRRQVVFVRRMYSSRQRKRRYRLEMGEHEESRLSYGPEY